jgi:predicted MFS family arabinose efflux permease
VGYLETSAVVGNMSGLFVAAFLSHFLGFIGPFAFIGTLSILLTLFMTKLVDFVKVKPQENE